MKYFYLFNTFLVLIFSSSIALANKQDGLEFIPNQGQWEGDFAYQVKLLDGGTMFMEATTFTFLYYEEAKRSWLHHNNCASAALAEGAISDPNNYCENDKIKHHVYKMKFVGANPNAIQTAHQPKDFYYNYILGDNPQNWKSKIHPFQKIEYKDFYTGIDLVVYSQDNGLKYDYIVHPNANPDQIKVEYEGLEKIGIDTRGNLLLKTSFNTITEFAPFVYQIVEGQKRQIAAKYVMEGNQQVLIKITGKYNKQLPLIIDPALVASTYSGSTADNWGYTATYDRQGNMYAGGMAVSGGYPTTVGAYDVTFNGGNTGSGSQATDIVISKFSGDGRNLLWSTYIGGNNNELPHSLLVDDDDQLVMYGTTGSSNFPITTGPSFAGGVNVLCGQSVRYPNGSDIVLLKLNATGSALVNSRFFGGSGNDGLNTTGSNNLEFNYGDYARGDIEFASNGDVVLASCSFSSTLPGTAGRFQPNNSGGLDAIVVRFSGDLSTLQWATFYGGSGNDAAYDIEIEGNGNLIIAGGTQSSNFPGMNGLNSTFQGGSADGYLARLNSSGTAGLNGTYLGTNEYDQAFFVDTDQFGFVYTYGHTVGQYPVLATWSRNLAPQFIHKLSNNMSNTIYSTVFGRENYVNQNRVNLSPTAFLVDKCENVYCMGWGGTSNTTWNNNAGTTGNMGEWGTGTGSIFNTNGDSDFYLFVLEKDANDALFASRLGESDNAFFGTGADHVDGGTSRFDPDGFVYHAVCASCGGSDGFPTSAGAYSSQNRSSNCNLAVFKIEFDLSPINTEIGLDTETGCAPLTVNFENLTNKPFVPGMTIIWDFGDGTTAVDIEDPTHTFTDPGTYQIQLVVTDPAQCNTSDTAQFELVVSESGAVADFSMDVSNICTNGEVTFTNNSLNTNSYVWLYGDGNTSTTNASTHTYTYAGTGPYTVSLIAVDGTPCATNDTLTQVIAGGCCPIFQSVSFTNEICDLNNGSMTVNVENSGVAPYDYSLDGGVNFILNDFNAIANFTDLNSGTYEIVVRDANNCEIDTTITLSNSGQSNIVTFNEVSCNPADTGTMELDLFNQFGCDSFVTVITTLIDAFDIIVNLETCNPAEVGVVTETFTTTLGCDSIVTTSTILVEFFSDTIHVSTCDPGQIGTAIDSFTTAQGCDSIMTTITTLSPSQIDTIYSITCNTDDVGITENTFLNQFGCDSTIVEVTTLSTFSLDSITIVNADCNGDNGTLEIFVSGENPPLQMEVTNIFGTTTTLNSSPANLAAGNYTLTVSDASECAATTSFTILSDSALQVEVIPDNASIFEGEFIELTAIPPDGLFQWSPPDFLTCFDCPTTTANPEESIFYIITRSLDGCVATDTVFIEVKEPNGFIPSAFTPNGDGLNDVLLVIDEFVKELNFFRVYNRWGKLLFETSNLQEGWDGTFNGKMQELDTYIYHIDLILKTENPLTIRGPVLLFR
jgi:gliding motility-associated-like protein